MRNVVLQFIPLPSSYQLALIKSRLSLPFSDCPEFGVQSSLLEQHEPAYVVDSDHTDDLESEVHYIPVEVRRLKEERKRKEGRKMLVESTFPEKINKKNRKN